MTLDFEIVSPRVERTEANQARVRARVSVCPLRGCWVWTGPLNKVNGRGEIRIAKKGPGSLRLAYRFSYEAFVGPVPPGLFVCHRCDDGRCCNPEHLFLGTHADNMADMDAKGRRRAVGPDKALRGRKHPNNKLGDAQVLDLRAKWGARQCSVEEFCREHAARLGVSSSLVKKIVYRTNWRWL